MHYKEGISISSAIVVASSYFLVSLLVYLEFGLVSDLILETLWFLMGFYYFVRLSPWALRFGPPLKIVFGLFWLYILLLLELEL
jgi:hypothetical protein